MIKAIVFDVDGTLLRNVDALADGWKDFAKRLDLKPPTKKQVRDFLGIPYYEISPQLWHGFNPYENAELFKQCVSKYVIKVKPILTKELILNIKKKYKIGIVTSARRNNIEVYLSEIIDLFDLVITPENTTKHKPDPEPLVKWCKEMKIKPEEVLYVGDAVFDFLCARGAGSSFVGVLTGVMSSNQFKKLSVPYIKSVKEVEKYAGVLNGK